MDSHQRYEAIQRAAKLVRDRGISVTEASHKERVSTTAIYRALKRPLTPDPPRWPFSSVSLNEVLALSPAQLGYVDAQLRTLLDAMR
jgi:hypothetical protein